MNYLIQAFTLRVNMRARTTKRGTTIDVHILGSAAIRLEPFLLVQTATDRGNFMPNEIRRQIWKLSAGRQ
jgi:hypothetical protein